MSGYETVLRIRRIEQEVNKLGLMLCNPKHFFASREYGEVVAVKPKDRESLPVYARDAELFVGTLEQLEVWINGVHWARQYDELMRVSDNKKRGQKEQAMRKKHLLETLKDGKLVEGTANSLSAVIRPEDC